MFATNDLKQDKVNLVLCPKTGQDFKPLAINRSITFNCLTTSSSPGAVPHVGGPQCFTVVQGWVKFEFRYEA